MVFNTTIKQAPSWQLFLRSETAALDLKIFKLLITRITFITSSMLNTK